MKRDLRAFLKNDYYEGGRKRLFIGIFCVTCVLVCLACLCLLILPWFIHDTSYLRLLSLGTGILGICLLGWLCLMLVFHIYTGRYLPGISWVRHVMIRIMLPMMEVVGKLCGQDKSLIRRSFIKINNEFVLTNLKSVRPDKLLLLLPHCVQWHDCPRRLHFSLANCLECGKCQIGWMKRLAAQYGCQLAIASGGTVARRIVVECRPDFIVAVACERDLTSGIQDSYPIPVFGVLNRRPFGPCIDTSVPEDYLSAVLATFCARPGQDPVAYAHLPLGRPSVPM